MGDDTPMPVLSHKIRSLYDYFRQQFAQVTNPPIDPLRESIVMSLSTQIGPECNVFVPLPEHARQIVLNSPVLSQRKLRQILASEDVVEANEFLDLQYEPAEGLKTAILRVCDQAEARCATASWCCCCPIAICSRASCRSMRCWPPARCITAWSRPACAASATCWSRPAPCATRITLPPHRLRRHRGVSVHGLPDAVRDDAQGPGEARLAGAARARPQLPARRAQGPVQDHVEDGHLDHRQLPRRAAVRDRGTVERSGGAVLPPHHQPHRGRGFRGPGRRYQLSGDARLESARRRRAGRHLQVRPRRRIPHVQPRCGRRAAGRGGLGRLRALPALRAAGERPAGLGAARPAGAEEQQAADPDRGGRAARGGAGALRWRRHVARRALARGARGAGDRDEPPGRPLQLRRGRRGSGALRHREEFQDQAGGLGPFRRHAGIPDQCRGAADQDRAGRQARRGRTAARPQGQRDDRAAALCAPRGRIDLAAAASRHLLDRGSGAADLRSEAGQPDRAGVGEAGGRARRRYRGGRRRQGLRGSDHDLRSRRRHRRQSRCPRSSTPARPGSWDWPRPTRRCAPTTCAIGCGCRPMAA